MERDQNQIKILEGDELRENRADITEGKIEGIQNSSISDFISICSAMQISENFDSILISFQFQLGVFKIRSQSRSHLENDVGLRVRVRTPNFDFDVF